MNWKDDIIFSLSAARCSFALTNFTRTIPAFSSYRLLQNSKFTLESKLSNFSNVLKTGRCTAKSIHYINYKGEPKKIFENECSETMAIFSKKSPSNEIIHQLSVSTSFFICISENMGRLGVLEPANPDRNVRQQENTCPCQNHIKNKHLPRFN